MSAYARSAALAENVVLDTFIAHQTVTLTVVVVVGDELLRRL
jgi:hypothetical protein